jgi:hypothetical protein
VPQEIFIAAWCVIHMRMVSSPPIIIDGLGHIAIRASNILILILNYC